MKFHIGTELGLQDVLDGIILQKQQSSEQETLFRKYFAIFARVPKKFAIKIVESEVKMLILLSQYFVFTWY